MEDYEEHLHGVEDDFHNQFAAELEVLAELEGGRGSWVAVRVCCILFQSWSWDRQAVSLRFAMCGCCDPLSQQGRRTWRPLAPYRLQRTAPR